MKRVLLSAGVAALAFAALVLPAVRAADVASAPVDQLNEFTLSAPTAHALRDRWVDQLEARYGDGHWAPMKMTLDDADLALLGLPPKAVLTSHRYAEPTWFDASGTPHTISLASGGKSGGRTTTTTSPAGPTPTGGPTATTYAGIGSFGIRPGAWLLTVTDQEIGWCSLAHVYGSTGAYQISTAGHCGKTGDIATAIGFLGNRPGVPVLLDFGKYSKSTGDAGIGKDWALISVDSAYQSLVSPTMAFWGGPFGIYRKTGAVVVADLFAGKGPTASVTPDPLLAQGVIHYGHGVGTGTGGTPRIGAAITWQSTYYAFFGDITPGDSGSGANVLVGDSPATSEREAAGINTHIYVDASLKTGVGYLAGTRATLVSATIANGQLVALPVGGAG